MSHGDTARRVNDDILVMLGKDSEGRVEAWVPARPGCVVFAHDETDALRHIPKAVYEYDGLLRRYGLGDLWRVADASPASGEPANVRVIERVDVGEPVV